MAWYSFQVIAGAGLGEDGLGMGAVAENGDHGDEDGEDGNSEGDAGKGFGGLGLPTGFFELVGEFLHFLGFHGGILSESRLSAVRRVREVASGARCRHRERGLELRADGNH